MDTPPTASQRSSCDAKPERQGESGERYRLELRAGVGVNFAVEANFFKSRSCPLHDDFPQLLRHWSAERGVSLADARSQSNPPKRKNFTSSVERALLPACRRHG